jgi:hypothetical protein
MDHARRPPPAAPAAPTPAAPALFWSVPLTVEGWAQVFRVSRNVMAARLKDGSIQAREFGGLWQIDLAQLVPEVRLRYAPGGPRGDAL